jgi:hypothetical protein
MRGVLRGFVKAGMTDGARALSCTNITTTEATEMSNSSKCFICLCPFGTDQKGGFVQAVRTTCEHVFCRRCMDKWARERCKRINDPQCPHCRHVLGDRTSCEVAGMPEDVREVAQKYASFFRSRDTGLDELVDEFLLASREGDANFQKCYNASVGSMLQRLSDRYRAVESLRGEFLIRA